MHGFNQRRRWPTRSRLLLLTMFGVAAAAALAAVAMAPTSRVAAKPSVTQPPTISGSATENSTLTADHGNWDGTQPITFAYSWQRCDKNGGSCATISGATQQTYVLKTVDNGNTLRVRVTATNAEGNTSATSVPTALVTAATAPAPTPAPTATGCPKTTQGAAAVSIADLSAPARLQIDQFQSTPSVILGSTTAFSVRVHVTSTCGDPVAGANVLATAVPYNQFTIPPQAATGSDGWVTLQFSRERGFPASPKQQLMVMFVRATKPGENPLAGVSTRRLVSFKVNLHG
jgi:hypothetical protein